MDFARSIKLGPREVGGPGFFVEVNIVWKCMFVNSSIDFRQIRQIWRSDKSDKFGFRQIRQNIAVFKSYLVFSRWSANQFEGMILFRMSSLRERIFFRSSPKPSFRTTGPGSWRILGFPTNPTNSDKSDKFFLPDGIVLAPIALWNHAAKWTIGFNGR